MVHGIAIGIPRASNRTPRAEALAIGRPEGLLAILISPIRLERSLVELAYGCAKADLLKLLTQEMQISCVFGLKYHKTRLSTKKQGI